MSSILVLLQKMQIKNAANWCVGFNAKLPKVLVVITGCYAQLKPKEIAEIPGVDSGAWCRRKI